MPHFQEPNSIYNQHTMKAKHIFSVVFLFLTALTIVLALTNFNPPAAFAQNTIPMALQQATPTPVVDSSEIGSTNGILIMGIVIVLIVTLPLILHKKK